MVKESLPSDRNVAGAAIAFVITVALSALLFVLVREVAGPPYYEEVGATLPALVLFWPMWGAMHAFLARSGLLTPYREVSPPRLGGLIQKQSSVRTPVKQGFWATVLLVIVIVAVAIGTAAGN